MVRGLSFSACLSRSDHGLSSPCSFGTPGMYSAVSNLGAGGTQDVALSDTTNGVLYGMFAITGLISGSINNCEFDYAVFALTSPLSCAL